LGSPLFLQCNLATDISTNEKKRLNAGLHISKKTIEPGSMISILLQLNYEAKDSLMDRLITVTSHIILEELSSLPLMEAVDNLPSSMSKKKICVRRSLPHVHAITRQALGQVVVKALKEGGNSAVSEIGQPALFHVVRLSMSMEYILTCASWGPCKKVD
jgi:hypothetical protein